MTRAHGARRGAWHLQLRHLQRSTRPLTVDEPTHGAQLEARQPSHSFVDTLTRLCDDDFARCF